MSVNKCIIIGNLGADPEIRTTNAGNKVAALRVATSERWTGNDGQKQERTEWHSIAVVHDAIAGIAERYLRKGSKVYVEGQLHTRKWTDKAGSDRYKTEVVVGVRGQLVMLDAPSDKPANVNAYEDPYDAPNDAKRAASGTAKAKHDRPFDDEIPF